MTSINLFENFQKVIEPVAVLVTADIHVAISESVHLALTLKAWTKENIPWFSCFIYNLSFGAHIQQGGNKQQIVTSSRLPYQSKNPAQAHQQSKKKTDL